MNVQILNIFVFALWTKKHTLNTILYYFVFFLKLCVSKLQLFMEDADQNCKLLHVHVHVQACRDVYSIQYTCTCTCICVQYTGYADICIMTQKKVAILIASDELMYRDYDFMTNNTFYMCMYIHKCMLSLLLNVLC